MLMKDFRIVNNYKRYIDSTKVLKFNLDTEEEEEEEDEEEETEEIDTCRLSDSEALFSLQPSGTVAASKKCIVGSDPPVTSSPQTSENISFNNKHNLLKFEIDNSGTTQKLLQALAENKVDQQLCKNCKHQLIKYLHEQKDQSRGGKNKNNFRIVFELKKNEFHVWSQGFGDSDNLELHQSTFDTMCSCGNNKFDAPGCGCAPPTACPKRHRFFVDVKIHQCAWAPWDTNKLVSTVAEEHENLRKVYRKKNDDDPSKLSLKNEKKASSQPKQRNNLFDPLFD